MAVEQMIEGSTFTSPLVLPLIATVVALAVVHFWQQNRRERKIGDLIPGPPTIPLVGNAHYFLNMNNDGESRETVGCTKIIIKNSVQQFSPKQWTLQTFTVMSSVDGLDTS